ncbi:unnamed protein product [Camellia sinensis]
MGVTIVTDVWEPNRALYVFILVSCSLSIFCLPQLSSNSNRTLARTPFDHSLPSSLFRFQRSFLLLYSLSSVMEGLWSVFGEYELSYYGVGREQMVLSLCVGYAAALFLGTFLGMLSDLMSKESLFDILHAAPLCWSVEENYCTSKCLTWMVVEHDKLVYRQDTLNDLFWLMTFTESASFISSQVIANSLVGSYVDKTMLSASTAAVFLAILSIIFITRGWKKDLRTASLKDYRISFNAHIFGDKRVWLLAWAQACVQFSIAVFWILWAPTIVADGQEVHLGLIYPCLLGARMLGSTAFPWFFSGMLSIQPEDCLVYGFIVMGFVLSIVAYDYQEIGVLVALFCLFHACVGLILPSLARLRTMYIPNNLRGGMISLSHSPANAAILFFLLQRALGEATPPKLPQIVIPYPCFQDQWPVQADLGFTKLVREEIEEKVRNEEIPTLAKPFKRSAD